MFTLSVLPPSTFEFESDERSFEVTVHSMFCGPKDGGYSKIYCRLVWLKCQSRVFGAEAEIARIVVATLFSHVAEQ